jgi:hypothetical protein
MRSLFKNSKGIRALKTKRKIHLQTKKELPPVRIPPPWTSIPGGKKILRKYL